jgi:hypothetical protein
MHRLFYDCHQTFNGLAYSLWEFSGTGISKNFRHPLLYHRICGSKLCDKCKETGMSGIFLTRYSKQKNSSVNIILA